MIKRKSKQKSRGSHLLQDEDRKGKCYQLAYLFMLDNIDNDFTLVHAEVYSFVLKQRMGHALVEIHPDVIWEPVKDTYLPIEFLYEHFQVVELGRYTVNEALYMAVETKLYGPWDRQEHKEILEKRRNEDGNRKRPV